MTTFLIILLFLLTVIAAVGMVLFIHSRKLLREQKNYERGLKMIPLLIHLPPPSDDIQGSGRDVRDILDENISKAQVLYNIIASTLKKGFKSKFYGQRHFAFEIVGSKGFVHFYAAVPVAMVDVVKQAVVSAYPAARLEEVAEHNIFSPVGKISGTIGGELTLKENFAYPIATFHDLKQDTMQALLNALSTLDKEDGVGIQILMRPASTEWRKGAQALAGKKRKGKKNKEGLALVLDLGRQLAAAVVKAPEEKKDGASDKPELSQHEQSVLDAIDEKTSQPGFEVLIRVVASSNIAQRAQVILNNVVASFSLFDAPGRNGFKYTPSKDIDSFVTAYILRFFPQENNQDILNSIELATLFHFPDQRNIPTTQLERQNSKQVDGPRNISEQGQFLGYNVFRGVKKAIRLDENDRRRHMYLVGQTGTGKSTLLENLALQDMLSGRGFAFIDPHGDTAERLLAMVPRERTEDVIYFCPADMDYPIGLNLFEFDSPDQKDFLIQEAINMLYKLYDPQHQGIIGPRYEHWFRNAALTVMASPEGGTFIDIPKVFTDKQYENMLKSHVTDQTVLDFWNKEMAQTSDYHKSEVLGWFVSKFGAFMSNEMMRNIIGQSKSSFNLREVMDKGKILLVNLSKGRTGELNSKLLGMIFVMKFQAAAMSRANVPEDQRKDFSLYVDEFQNFSTDSFATILSEARKYRLSLIVANQFTTQLTEEIRDAVFGNIGSIISFRVGTNDAEFLAKQFSPIFDLDDLQRIPNYNAVVRMLIGGIPAQPFSMATVPPLGEANQKLADALKQLSAAKYGRPKAKVEATIFSRLRTPDVPPRPPARPAGSPPSPYAMQQRPAAAQFGPAPSRPATFTPPAYPTAVAPPRTPTTGSSFLDEWLNKRKGATRPPSAPLLQNSPRLAPQTQRAQPPSTRFQQPQQTSPPGRMQNKPPKSAVPAGAMHRAGHPVIQPLHPGIKPAFNPELTQHAAAEISAAKSSVPQQKRQVPESPKTIQGPPVLRASAGNISSEQLADEEVSTIANELRHTLDEAKIANKKNTKTVGEFNLNQTESADIDDTIYIDQQGNLHPKEPGSAIVDHKDQSDKTSA